MQWLKLELDPEPPQQEQELPTPQPVEAGTQQSNQQTLATVPQVWVTTWYPATLYVPAPVVFPSLAPQHTRSQQVLPEQQESMAGGSEDLWSGGPSDPATLDSLRESVLREMEDEIRSIQSDHLSDMDRQRVADCWMEIRTQIEKMRKIRKQEAYPDWLGKATLKAFLFSLSLGRLLHRLRRRLGEDLARERMCPVIRSVERMGIKPVFVLVLIPEDASPKMRSVVAAIRDAGAVVETAHTLQDLRKQWTLDVNVVHIIGHNKAS
eukprot:1965416-Amphidinium_carterae.1